MKQDLGKLAARYAIQPEYEGIGGETHEAPPETLEKLLAAFGVSGGDHPALDPPELAAPEGVTCYLPSDGGMGRVWGIAIQLYQLRSARNWGMGDFADLEALARVCGAAGADFIGLNPLHALFLTNPAHCSPFSPSNRRFLNPLYIAVDRVEGFDGEVPPQDDGELVDYAAVAARKIPALRGLWRQADRSAMPEFREQGGEALRRHALFEAASFHMVAQGHGPGWQSWPEEWQDVESPAIAAFAEEHADEVDFHIWLQWLADRQLAAARDACMAAGMRIGLYLDFAVGEAADGSGTWSDRKMVVPSVRIGAPPDYFNAAGQDWGLAPLSPVAMAETRAAPFRTLMEDATKRAGALRIDHAMALWQLFLIPDGMTAADGTYARYPIQDMIGALAKASQDNRTIIIGEDLGNVPDGFREVMDEAGILSYRILLFERDDDGFIAPDDYPENALVCLATHDLPTFQGWWRCDDVALRAGFDLIGADAAAEQAASREVERADLLGDLVAAGLLDQAKADAVTEERAPEDLVVATHRFLARAPSRLFAVRLEDLAGEMHPVNLPSTVDEYPNWRRRLGVTLEDLPQTTLFKDITAGLRAERPGRG